MYTVYIYHSVETLKPVSRISYVIIKESETLGSHCVSHTGGTTYAIAYL